MPYYRRELARIHHEAFADYADLVAPGILERLGEPRSVVELGAGSGALTRHLLMAGHRVVATDASPEMVELATTEVPDATPFVLVLPDDPIPRSDAVVAAGHVFNYLDSETEIERGLHAAADSADVLICDMLDLSYGVARPDPVQFFHEGEGWELRTENRLETPSLVIREMTIEMEGKTSHEVHRNVLVDVNKMASNLEKRGMRTRVDRSFGAESLPDGYLVVEARRVNS